MTVKELITRLLDEDMDSKVMLSTTDESMMTKTSTKTNNIVFEIEGIEDWGGSSYIYFTDWRKETANDDSND